MNKNCWTSQIPQDQKTETFPYKYLLFLKKGKHDPEGDSEIISTATILVSEWSHLCGCNSRSCHCPQPDGDTIQSIAFPSPSTPFMHAKNSLHTNRPKRTRGGGKPSASYVWAEALSKLQAREDQRTQIQPHRQDLSQAACQLRGLVCDIPKSLQDPRSEKPLKPGSELGNPEN